MSDALKKINEIIYAQGAPVGSPEYFEIREICCTGEKDTEKMKAEIERLRGLLATGAGCEEGYRQHYTKLLDKCEADRKAAIHTAQQNTPVEKDKWLFRQYAGAVLSGQMASVGGDVVLTEAVIGNMAREAVAVATALVKAVKEGEKWV